MQATTGNRWQEELREELQHLAPVLSGLGYTLEEQQPHIKGERFLLGGSNKVVVNAADKNGKRVVIKASRNASGIADIREEKRVRDALSRLTFAADSLKIPTETYFGEQSDYTLFMTEYIEQDAVLAERPLEERFFMALRALEAQEAFHATTYEHVQEAKADFPIFDADAYARSIYEFKDEAHDVRGASELLDAVASELERSRTILDRYNNYLAHYDFVPHNIRVEGRTIWILDFTRMRFGNKYESWARFINYMLIHDPELADALLSYVREERGEDESEALRLMRLFKAALLVGFYARTLPKTNGNYRTLTELRVDLWMDIVKKLLEHAPFPEANADGYRAQRDSLRSEEEKERQRGFDIK